MTLFLWDTSHYDGTISVATAKRAMAEGIIGATAKIGEGGNYDDPNDAVNLSAFRAAGMEFLGGYYVVRSGSVAPQVANCIRLADRDEPWWRSFSGWFWQVDLEKWPYDSVPAATGIAFGNELAAQTGKKVMMYASRGQYGNDLTGWRGDMWNADYGNQHAAPFKIAYPGDGGRGWTAYSGKIPKLWQYTSLATIAGLTTCDANAFRGTEAELRALITGSGNSSPLPVGADVGFEEIISSPGLNRTAPAAQWIKDIYENEIDIESKIDLILSHMGTPAPVVLTGEDLTAIAALVAQSVAPAIEAFTSNVIAAIAALDAKVRDAVADLGEGGASQVRAG